MSQFEALNIVERPVAHQLFLSAFSRGHQYVFKRGQFGKQVMKLEHESHFFVSELMKLLAVEGMDVFFVKQHLARCRIVEAAGDVQ